ncbi:MAG: hypothetical protein JKX75_03295 [Gammaproteobacteria bacterium]|nr:hypothetical protein [Gammaproteobacteria bacterium]
MKNKDKVENKLMASIRKTKQGINDSKVDNNKKETSKKVKVADKQKTQPISKKVKVADKQNKQPVSKKAPEVKSGYIQTANNVWPD